MADPAEVQQGTDEWHKLRLGRVTASRIADVMARGRSGAPSATRAKYMGQLIAERLSGEPSPSFTSATMQWGTDTEPMARTAYEFLTDSVVVQTGFCVHPQIIDSGASPDGLVGDDGLIEIKCPETHTHIETRLGASIDGKYVKQIQWQLDCTGRQWCDFVSFDPRLPPRHQLHIQRIERDKDVISEMRREVMRFLSEMRKKIEDLEATP